MGQIVVDPMVILQLWSLACLFYTGFAGLIWLGIRNERMKLQSLLKQSIRNNIMNSTRRR